MNFPLFIARRLSLKPDRRKAFSPGVVVGIVGVTLSVAIMLLSISVVKGFKQEIAEKLVGFNSDIMVFAPEDAEQPAITSGLRLSDSLKSIIEEAAPGSRADLIIRQPAIFKTDTDFQGIILKGLPKGDAWQFYGLNLTQGKLPDPADEDYPNQAVVSSVTASQLGVKVGDKLTTHFLNDESLRTRRLTVTGIYDSHFHDFDRSIALTPLEMLQQLSRVDSIVGTMIEIRGVDIDKTPETVERLSSLTLNATLEKPENPMVYRIESILKICSQYFNWLDLLDTNVIVIIILMACVSGFTLISSLFIIILERVNTIGLLKALGSPNVQIRRIFIYMAQRLVIAGLIVGNLITLLVIWLQRTYRLIPLDPEAYYLNYVPMEISWQDFAIVNVSAIVIAILILILPSHMIATLSPARSMRYE